MVTVKVIWESTGKPAKGKRVSLGFDGLLTGGFTDSEFTDDNGEVHFETDPRDGQVYVDGKSKYKGRISGRVVIYI